MPAFLAADLIKTVISSGDDPNTTKSANLLERVLHKTWEQLDGKYLTCAYFTARWLTYSSSRSATNDDYVQPAPAAVPGLYPEASERLLTADDLNQKSGYDLKIMRNEIYVRHGYIFQTPQMKAYFDAQNWYRGLYNYVDDRLTTIEKSNVELIKSYERR